MPRISLPLGKDRAATVDGSPVIDLKSCERWLADAPLADPRQACFELTTLLEDLEERPPAAKNLLDVLEKLREAVRTAQDECSKRFSARPLPLADVEATIFDQVLDLWTAYGRAYRKLALQAREQHHHALAKRLPLLLGRALEMTGHLIAIHYRARRDVAAEAWRDLHELFTIAESAGIERVGIDEGKVRSPSCLEIYVRSILLHAASPYSLAVREMEWLRRWIRMWAGKVMLAPPVPDRDLISVNLDSDDPPRALRGAIGAHWRALDTRELRKSVRKRIRGLQDGYSSTDMGLGEDCHPYEAVQLLLHLDVQWFQSPIPRQFKRRLVTGRAEVAVSFEEIHLAIGGRLAAAPRRAWDYSRHDVDQLFLYGKTDLDFTEGETRSRAERWEQLDDSATGFRLRRRPPGERLSHRQLIALRPEDAPTFILCEVRWLTQSIEGALVMGVQALPGLAQPISARPQSTNAAIETRFQPAFVLPPSPGIRSTLVLPSGSYRDERMIELRYEDTVRHVKLLGLEQRGYDFERCTFEIVL